MDLEERSMVPMSGLISGLGMIDAELADIERALAEGDHAVAERQIAWLRRRLTSVSAAVDLVDSATTMGRSRRPFD